MAYFSSAAWLSVLSCLVQLGCVLAFMFLLDGTQRLSWWLVGDKLSVRDTFLFVLAALAGLARVGVGAHWPSDVMVGSAIGLFSGVAGAAIAARAPAQWLIPQSWLMRILAAGALLCAYVLATSEIDFPSARAFQPAGIAVVAVTLVLFARQTLRAPQR